MTELGPFFLRYSWDGEHLLIDKGPFADWAQTQVGDLIMRAAADRCLYAVEVKVEARWTGNCFLETWSNKPTADSDRCKPGWFKTLERCDVLACYYLDTKQLYTLPYRRLRCWAFDDNRLEGFPEVEQRRHQQMNRTHGRIVPWNVLGREVGYRHYVGPRFDESQAYTVSAVKQLTLI